jgi:hypothetical protein
MSADPERWLLDLHPIIDGEVYEDRHRNWGFTIYRTAYGPSTDQQWQRLLQTIQTHAYKSTLSITGITGDDPIFQKLWSLFCLDARSDASLSGLNVDQLRLLYNNHKEGPPPMNTDYKLHRIFLVADDETFRDIEPDIIKAMDADYRAEDYVPKNNRCGGQRYFGWMPMRAGYVAELWARLDIWELQRIAPSTIAGSHLVVWDDGCM